MATAPSGRDAAHTSDHAAHPSVNGHQAWAATPTTAHLPSGSGEFVEFAIREPDPGLEANPCACPAQHVPELDESEPPHRAERGLNVDNERKRRRGSAVPVGTEDAVPPHLRPQIERLKRLGNQAFRAGRFAETIARYSEAVALAPDHPMLYSNRSAAHVAAGNLVAAVADARNCVRLRPAWSKGHARLGTALQLAGDDAGSFAAFARALHCDPDNSLAVSHITDIVLRAAHAAPPRIGCRRRPFAPLACCECQSLLHRPSALRCGHLVCASCVRGECPVCAVAVAAADVRGTCVAAATAVLKALPAHAEALGRKEAGNTAFARGDMATAMAEYSAGLARAPDLHVLFSNRSAVRLATGDAHGALADALCAAICAPRSWTKAWLRAGNALAALHLYSEAAAAFVRCATAYARDAAARRQQAARREAREAQESGQCDTVDPPVSAGRGGASAPPTASASAPRPSRPDADVKIHLRAVLRALLLSSPGMTMQDVVAEVGRGSQRLVRVEEAAMAAAKAVAPAGSGAGVEGSAVAQVGAGAVAAAASQGLGKGASTLPQGAQSVPRDGLAQALFDCVRACVRDHVRLREREKFGAAEAMGPAPATATSGAGGPHGEASALTAGADPLPVPVPTPAPSPAASSAGSRGLLPLAAEPRLRGAEAAMVRVPVRGAAVPCAQAACTAECTVHQGGGAAPSTGSAVRCGCGDGTNNVPADESGDGAGGNAGSPESAAAQAAGDGAGAEPPADADPSIHGVADARWVRSAPLFRDDMDCTLCFSLIYDPVVTECGHVFCRDCLARALDHSNHCPMCRTELSGHIGRYATAPSLAALTRACWVEEVAERAAAAQQALADKARTVPIFVCNLALPRTACPLHIFEPRYRLMIRRCLQSRLRCFGMCTPTGSGAYADYGTLLFIRRVRILGDGRSLVDTIGVRRLHVVDRFTQDGYNMARVEWVDDDPDPNDPTRCQGSVADVVPELPSVFLPRHGAAGAAEPSTGDGSTAAATSVPPSPASGHDARPLCQLASDTEREVAALVAMLRETPHGANYLAQVLAKNGPCRSCDADALSWWALDMLPVPEEAKYRLLTSRSVRRRLRVSCSLIASLRRRAGRRRSRVGSGDSEFASDRRDGDDGGSGTGGDSSGGGGRGGEGSGRWRARGGRNGGGSSVGGGSGTGASQSSVTTTTARAVQSALASLSAYHAAQRGAAAASTQRPPRRGGAPAAGTAGLSRRSGSAQAERTKPPCPASRLARPAKSVALNAAPTGLERSAASAVAQPRSSPPSKRSRSSSGPTTFTGHVDTRAQPPRVAAPVRQAGAPSLMER